MMLLQPLRQRLRTPVPGGSRPPPPGLPGVLSPPLDPEVSGRSPVTPARCYARPAAGRQSPAGAAPCPALPGQTRLAPAPQLTPSSFSKVAPVWINMMWPTKLCVTPNHLQNTYMFTCLFSERLTCQEKETLNQSPAVFSSKGTFK